MLDVQLAGLGASSPFPQLTVPILGVTPGSGWYRARESGPHQALDFFVPVGTPVYAAASGVVARSKDHGTVTGKHIFIEHDGEWTGLQTRYLHLSKRLVQKGDRVIRGQLIAKSGDTDVGKTGAHLHFDLGARGDALEAVKRAGIRVGKLRTGFYMVPAEFFMNLPGFDLQTSMPAKPGSTAYAVDDSREGTVPGTRVARAVVAVLAPWTVLFG